MTVILATEAPFARGGNRLCYVHPDHADRVIKVQRPDFPLEERRRRKGFPKTLRPLSSFDDNLQEFREMQMLDRVFREPLYRHVSRCYGFEVTDMGAGLVSELIRDDSGAISHTLKQYIWDQGYDERCQQAVAQFAQHWIALGVPSRDLLLHNLVAQRDSAGNIKRLVIIDGIGNPGWIPLGWWPRSLRVAKARRKIANLHLRIQTLLPLRGQDKFPGYHGRLFHDGQPPADG
jgi:hypothetical protein